MVVNLTEIDMTGMLSNPSTDNIMCHWNIFFDSIGIFILLLCIMVILSIAISIRYENPISLSIFIGSGVTTMSALFLYFINVENCGRLLNFNQFSVFAVIFMISGLILWFDKNNKD